MDVLLDVNVLVALLWPAHTMHSLATAWFEKRPAGRKAWATCAITQAGAVRILSNPALSHGTISAARATAILEENLRRPGHKMWSMDFGWPEALELSRVEIQSHQQVTDIYLIALAVKHKGALATFDKALAKLNSNIILLG